MIAVMSLEIGQLGEVRKIRDLTPLEAAVMHRTNQVIGKHRETVERMIAMPDTAAAGTYPSTGSTQASQAPPIDKDTEEQS